ncbi:hypothetical protein Ddc_08165 [Ditylenchus destructor]|nr:hypothetical protein Ddc_08165 [Ditylenchus destructor]
MVVDFVNAKGKRWRSFNDAFVEGTNRRFSAVSKLRLDPSDESSLKGVQPPFVVGKRRSSEIRAGDSRLLQKLR